MVEARSRAPYDQSPVSRKPKRTDARASFALQSNTPTKTPHEYSASRPIPAVNASPKNAWLSRRVLRLREPVSSKRYARPRLRSLRTTGMPSPRKSTLLLLMLV